VRTKFWLLSLKGRDRSEDLGVDVSLILDGSEGNIVGGCGLDPSGSRRGSGGALF
jgi:hypothetical protein